MTGRGERWFDDAARKRARGPFCAEVRVNPAPTTTTAPLGTRRLLPAMRLLLLAFAVLTALAVVALFVLSENTEKTFAWTIQPPVTAAFLGAGYAAGFVLVVLSMRDPVWAHSRVPVLTILVFVVLTLVATLLHVNRMHFDDDFAGLSVLSRGAAWFWLAVYVVLPTFMAVLVWRQERAPGRDPAPEHPVPRALRVVLGVESVVLLVVGVVLFVAPTTTAVWPWALTPFTGRVVAAWLIAFGLATALAAVAGDLERLRTAAIAYTVFGVLVLVAVLRYVGDVAWEKPQAWVFLVLALAVVATGGTGWRIAPAPRARRA
jgi:hypothetical protein